MANGKLNQYPTHHDLIYPGIISISAKEYEVMSQIIRDYQAGKLSDSELMEAQKLLERWVQDAKHGLISKEKGQEAQQLLDRIAGTDVNASKGDYVIEKEINDGMRMILVAVVHLTKQSVKEKV